MIDELKNYIEELFTAAPKTKAAYELKEELLANSTERYFDLVENKVPEKEALEIVINSIGDINQLFSAEDEKTRIPLINEETLKLTALYKSIAVGLYIIGFCVMVALNELTGYSSIGFIAMLIITAIATAILVYVASAYPKYKKGNDTMVEEFKEWNSNQKKKKSIQHSVNTIIWMITLVLYFFISFTSGAWYITWLTFLIGVCAQAIANLLFQLYDR